MLVLTRKSNESIMIGDRIEVFVLSVVGDRVRIGIEAPSQVPVFRTEIYVEVGKRQRARAVLSNPRENGVATAVQELRGSG